MATRLFLRARTWVALAGFALASSACSSPEAAPRSLGGNAEEQVDAGEIPGPDASVLVHCSTSLGEYCAANAGSCPPRDLASGALLACARDPRGARTLSRSGHFVVVATTAREDASGELRVVEEDVYDANGGALVALFGDGASGSAFTCLAGPRSFDFEEGPITPLTASCPDAAAEEAGGGAGDASPDAGLEDAGPDDAPADGSARDL